MPKFRIKNYYEAKITEEYVVDVPDHELDELDIHYFTYSYIHDKEPRSRVIEPEPDTDEYEVEQLNVLEEIVEAVEEDDA